MKRRNDIIYMITIIIIIFRLYECINTIRKTNRPRKKPENILPKFSVCPTVLIPNSKKDKCQTISINDAEEILMNQQKFKTVSIVLNINKTMFNSYVCYKFNQNFIGNKSLFNCNKVVEICSSLNKRRIPLNAKLFMSKINYYGLDKFQVQVTYNYRVLLINVPSELLILAHYYLDDEILNNATLFRNFDLIIFQTEYSKYLFKIPNTKLYKYRLVFHQKRTKDFYYRLNLNFRHENILFMKKSRLGNFLKIKNKFKECSIYKSVYMHYLKYLKSTKRFFHYFEPIVSVGIDSIKHKHHILIKFVEYELWYKPGTYKFIHKQVDDNHQNKNKGPPNLRELIKNLTKNNLSMLQLRTKGKSAFPEGDEIFYYNKGDFDNREEFLERSVNERARGKRKEYNSSKLKNSLIELFKIDDEDQDDEQKDLEKL